ncbi:MAG: hypothetical protein AAF370_08915 [Pseudomonadota bacterium]
MPRLFNIPVDPALKARVEVAAEAQAEGAGCASVSLYRRFQQSELIDVTGQPLLAVFGDAYSTVGQFILGSTATMFTAEEAEAWWAAIKEADEDGTFFFTWPHHCAVGTKVMMA